MNGPQRPRRPWQAGLDARPLIAWRTGQLALVANTLRSALAAWAAEWGLPDSWHAQVECVSAQASELAAQAWFCLGRSEEGHAWLHPAPREQETLAQALFAGARPLTDLLLEIAESCQRDARARFASALRLQGAADLPEVSGAVFAPWSGSLLALLPGGGRVLMEGALVERLLQAFDRRPASAARSGAAPLIPLAQAMACMPLPIQVQLEGCEVAIATLQDLQAGDVLRLRHRLDAPLAVTADGGKLLFRGFLARSRGRKALELAPAGARQALA